MCTHHYKNYRLGEDSIVCSLQERIKDSKALLPLDENNLCIFHSQNKEWKKENNFNDWLELLIQSYPDEQSPDLREIHFVENRKKNMIDYLDILSGSNLTGSVFCNTICCEDLTFTEKLSFEGCTLPSTIIFRDCTFNDELTFIEISIVGFSEAPILALEKCHFNSHFIFDSPGIPMNFSISHCHFDAVQFESLSNHQELGSFDFVQCETGIFDMNNSILNSWIDFSGTGFTTGEFKDVTFRGETSFKSVRIEKNLKFHGGEGHSIFDGMTNFNIDWEQMRGELHFENANLSNILKSHKDILLDHEKNGLGQVKIGSGCIKYRIMTPDITYQIKEEHKNLISEIGTSFATYFTQHNGFNLGIEVRNKTRNSITLFYFTDEDILQEEFIQMLGTTSARIFGIIPEEDKSIAVREDAMINFQIDMMRSLTKVAYQIQKGNWTEEDSQAFFGPLSLAPQIHLDEKAAHAFLESIHVQETLRKIQEINMIVNQYGPKSIFVNRIEGNATFKDHQNKKEG